MRQPARHRRPVPLLAKALAVAAALIALAAGFAPGILGASAAPVRPVPAAVPVALSVPVLPPPAAPRAVTARVYTVRTGDTLSGVAARLCGKAADWTGIYAASRAARMTARDANVLAPGQHLAVICRYLPAMLKYAPAPPPSRPAVVTVAVVTVPSRHGAPAAYRAVRHRAAAHRAPAIVYRGSGSMQQCIIARESGGNAQVMNSTGHYGLYQFSASTWAAHGGSPASFGHASAAEQNRVYYATVAADGYSDWTPYDGCGS